MPLTWRLVLTLILAGFGACAPVASGAQPPDPVTRSAASTPLRVVVSLPPLKTIAHRLVPAGVEVDVLVPPGVSEHGYELPPSMLRRVDDADLVIAVGAGMEPQVDRVLRARPRADRRVVWFTDAVGVAEAPADHESHDHEHDHTCGAVDLHFWLSPPMMLKLVDAVEGALGESIRARGEDEEARAALRRRAEDLRRDIRGVDDRYRAALAKAPRRTIVTCHDAFGRLAEAYGLKVHALTGLSAGEPTLPTMREAARIVSEQGLTTIFVEPQLSPRAAQRVAEGTGAKIATLDPLGDGDWFKLMESNLRVLAEALGGTLPGVEKPAEPPK